MIQPLLQESGSVRRVVFAPEDVTIMKDDQGRTIGYRVDLGLEVGLERLECACGFGPKEHEALQGNCPVVEYVPARDFRGPR